MLENLLNKKRSVQELLGVKTFTMYGIATDKCEYLFYQVAPTNISVLSKDAITTKIRQLMLALSARPNLEFICTDASECFDDNKVYLAERIGEEMNPQIASLLKKDKEFLDSIQIEMATARQFAFIVRCKNLKPEQVFAEMNRVEKTISDQGFEVKRMSKEDIKRFLAIYFDASYEGDRMPDVDGSQYLEYEEGE